MINVLGIKTVYIYIYVYKGESMVGGSNSSSYQAGHVSIIDCNNFFQVQIRPDRMKPTDRASLCRSKVSID